MLFRSPPFIEPYAPYKLVAMMPDTGQVLLWSDVEGEYKLAALGDELDGWRLSGVDPKGQRISLQKEELIDELELVRLPRPGAVIVFKDTRPAATVDATRPATPITPTVIDAKPAAPPLPPPPPPPIEESHTVARADLDREINDFDKLMTTLKVAKADGGGFTIIRLEPKSWVASLGFKQGDVVRSLAGEQVSSVEDAARVYARLRTLETFNAEIERGGQQKVVLKFAVK